MGDPLFIGIDLGTTNGKVACYDSRGSLQAQAQRSYPTSYPKPGWAEQKPEDWIAALTKCLKESAADLGDRASDVSGISISNFGPGLVLVDQDGEPLSACPTWQDERCREQGERLIQDVGAGWIGLGPPLTGFPAKVLWTVEHTPELIAKSSMLLDLKGFLLHWLTGSAVTDPSSGPGANEWYEPAFNYAHVSLEQLARVVKPTSSPGGLQAELAHVVGLPSGIPVYAGINDGAAATLGSGVIHRGESIITLATNGVARVVVDGRLDSKTILDNHLFSWPYIEDHWICGGFTYSGAGSLQWLVEMMGLPQEDASYETVLSEAEQAPPGSEGVIFLPYLAGRGTPKADTSMRGGFLNLAIHHRRAVLTRALLEGITYSLYEIYDEFERQGIQSKSIRVTGGGAQSALWRQIIADVLNRSVMRAGGDATLGSVVVAAVGQGVFADFDTAAKEMVHTTSHETPDPGNAQAYDVLYKVFARARDACVFIDPLLDNETDYSGKPDSDQ
ncbi:MAG: FGGY family carbohydrate kinase [Anaerolineales bacterium]|nr:FGGY family carbohydrate kinase [Anaerolineales bacterium]